MRAGHALDTRSVLLVMLVATGLRLAAALAQGAFMSAPTGDERLFDPIARHLAAGEGYSIDAIHATAIRPPVYPTVLAAVYAVTGGSQVAGRLVNVFIGGSIVALVVLVATGYFGRTAGLLAGAVAALYPPWIEQSSKLLSDSLYLWLVLILLLQLQRADAEPENRRRWLVAGLVLGACILTRSEAVLLIAILPLGVLLASGWRGWGQRAAMGLALPALLLVTPWVLRNRAAIGSPVLASNLGQALWGVYQPQNFGDDDLLGTWTSPEPPVWNSGQYAPGSRKDEGTYLPEREYNRVLVGRAVEAARGHARQLPRMMLAKVNRFFLSRGHVENLFRFVILYCFLFGELLVLVAAWRSTWALQGIFLANLLVGILVYADERLRMPADLVLIVVGSYGFLRQVRLLREQRRHIRPVEQVPGPRDRDADVVAAEARA